jgi:threonine/homoserine/homoserine lactone efflux protein
MKHPAWKVYAVTVTILVLSFVTAWMATSELLTAILSIPGVAAMVAMLYQFIRDQAAHERALDLQEKQHRFDLGVTSHMANVAFDKHMAFVEKYISTMQEG